MTEPVSETGLVASLARVQAAVGVIPKTKTAKVKMKSGGEYSYTYADLGDVLAIVRPLLAAEGIAVTQGPDVSEHGPVLVTALLKGTEREERRMPLPMIGLDAQAVGSLITYWRRYALCSILGVAAEEDDDGRAAKDGKQPRQQRSTAAPAPPDEHLAEFNRLCAELGLDKAKDKAGFIACTVGVDTKWAQCSEETHVYIVEQLKGIVAGTLTLGFDNAGRPMAYPAGEEPFDVAPAPEPDADAVADEPLSGPALARSAARGAKP